MLVDCPACSTQYDLPDDQITGDGRNVRCVRCGHTWFLTAPAPEPPPQEDLQADPVTTEDVEAVDAAMAEALGEGDDEPAAEGATDEAPDEAEVAPELPTEEPDADADEGEDPWERRRRRNAALAADLPDNLNRRPDMPDVDAASGGGMRTAAGWLVFAAIVAGSAYGGHAYRDQMVEMIPQTQSVYQTLGYSFSGPLDGLDLADIKSDRSLENGSSVLVVEGKVTNASGENKRLPMLRAELLDANQNTITEWTFSIDLGVVAAGGEAPFRQEVVDPDPTAVDIQISFVQNG